MASTEFPHEVLATESLTWRNVHSHGISWGAAIAGAFIAAALSLILLALGAGFGLAVMSPWSNTGASAFSIGAGAILWLLIIQAVAWTFGGYLTGRCRSRWISVHSDEVYFRDTANGFLAWAVGTVLCATFLAASAATVAGGSSSPPAADGVYDPNAYFVDMLFRSDRPATAPVDPAAQVEAARILANALRKNEMPQEDHAHLAQLISTRSGLSYADADTRVTTVMNQARQAEDVTRKAASRALLWTFVALLVGAFCASFAATVGGRQRDHVRTI